MSTEHDVKVVRIGEVIKHPNADTLSVTNVEGRPCVVKSDLWKKDDLAIYIPIDSMVPLDDSRFSWLKKTPEQTGRYRVKAARFRGVFSMGILIPAEEGMSLGDEVSHKLRITVYEPPIEISNGEMESDPGFLPVYDIESLRKWGEKVLTLGEEVVLTEKIHGANGRFAYHRGRLWCASRTTFKREGTGSMWWEVAERYNLSERLAAVCPSVALYAEVYGQVQDLKYGQLGADLIIFDALDIETRRWFDYDELLVLINKLNADESQNHIRMVPTMYRGPWKNDLEYLAEGNSIVGEENGEKHVREGFVLKPTKERYHLELGRVILKLHGEGYLTRKGG